MIKLIACDMDGTLLDSQKRLPPELPEVIAQLREKGVIFCVASGRQYASLRRDFEAYADDLLFLCENGALVMQRDKRVLIDPVDASFITRIVTATRALSGVYPVVCRADVALIEKTASPEFIRNTKMYYPSVEVVDDLTALDQLGDVCKVAFYDEGDAQTHELPELKKHLEGPLGGHPLRRTLGGRHEAGGEQGLRDARHSAEAGHFAGRMYGVRRLSQRLRTFAGRRRELCDGKRAPRAQKAGAPHCARQRRQRRDARGARTAWAGGGITMHSREKRALALNLLLSLLMAAGYMLLFAYNNTPLGAAIGSDNAMYLTMGTALAKGWAPYVDVFDHKGPLLFALQGLPQWIGGGYNLTAVFLQEVVALFACLTVVRALAKALSCPPVWGAARLSGDDVRVHGRRQP